MLGRVIRSRLDLLHPDLRSRVGRRQLQQKLNHDPQVPRSVQFQVSDNVYARNYSVGPAWTAGVIMGVDGPVSFVVQLEDGRVWRRHKDQLRRKHDAVSSSPATGASADVTGRDGELRCQLEASPTTPPAADAHPREASDVTSDPERHPAESPHTAGGQSGASPDRPSDKPDSPDSGQTAAAPHSECTARAQTPHRGNGEPVRRSTRVRKQTDFFGDSVR